MGISKKDTFSHYLACQGITKGLRLGKPIIVNSDKITNIESLIVAKAPVSSDSRISQLSRELGLEKFDEFIGKYSSWEEKNDFKLVNTSSIKSIRTL